jgi:cyclophilin family peptidyl-prolyl cis-trans isomerase/uncharacterized SAM-binding protein YcdF (DUF218 family)
MSPAGGALAAIVVLGCPVRLGPDGRLRPGALARRLDAAAYEYARRGAEHTVVIVSGGRHWAGLIEADVMARELVWRGVPHEAVVRERCSLTTRDNARFAAAALERRGLPSALVVTCEWHLPRAMAHFRRAGVRVDGVGARDLPVQPWTTRVFRRARERLLMWMQTALVVLAALAALAACSKAPPAAADRQDAAMGLRAVDRDIELAEDRRRAKDVPPDAPRSADPEVRRRAARAFARILDPDDTPLLRALADDDEETIAWGGYGLGESCTGREESHVRALAARLATLVFARTPPADSPDPRGAIVRALGRCGGDLAEQTLRAFLRQRGAAGPSAEQAAYALGDLAVKRGSLSIDSAAVLLDVAQAAPALDAALYPFGRIEEPPAVDVEPRLLAAARAALGRPGPARIFAIRALGRTTRGDGAPDLAQVLSSSNFSAAERAEAARALGRSRDAGQVALAQSLGVLLSEGTRALTGERFGILVAAVAAVSEDSPKSAQPPLSLIARLAIGPSASPMIARRVSALRCAAAERLARGAWDSELLAGCDVGGGEAGERARLAALDRGSLVKARAAAWFDLARRTAHVRVREAAVETIAHHPELGDLARAVLADALAANEAGLVATAANVVASHPERLDPAIAAALGDALARPWTEDLVETRVALLDAALAVHLDHAVALARSACRDANVTVRARAAKALAAAGDVASCVEPGDAGSAPAREVDHPIGRPTRVTFELDSGGLAVTFDPALAPIAATRLVALSRSGFYQGITVHRVVPGFVVQLGDRAGDGYGGSGSLLRCETSPAPFGALDVGVALAGRDTGSSQFFVALARYPHLDGQYAWIGRAQGDWNAVAEGDVVKAVHVEE